jgi:predicted phage terminase large subunit-like protein
MTKPKTLKESTLQLICKNKFVRTFITRRSPFWFLHIYFADYLEYDTAPFQYQMLDLVKRDDWKLLCIVSFRGSSKTTLMATVQVLWSVLGTRQCKYVLIISANQTQAKQQMVNIRGVLENNETLKNDLGPFKDETDKFGSTSIVFSKLGARISVVSVNEYIRGTLHLKHRPDLVVVDDPEDTQSAKSKDGRDKIYNWFKSEVLPIGSKRARFVVLGNVVHERCLAMRLKQEINDGVTSGIYHEYSILNSEGESMWPGKFPTLKDVEEERKRIGNDRTWFREYLLKIIPDEDQIIKPEYIHYYDVLPTQTRDNQYRFSASAVDLAVKQGEKSDYTAIVSAHIYGFGKDMKIYVLPYPINRKMQFPEIVTTIKSVSTMLGKGNRTKTYVEGNAAQCYAIQQLIHEGFYTKEVISRGEKGERLACVSPSIFNGQILFPRKGCELLISQMVNFGLEDHDDLCDAVVMLINEILKEGGNYEPFSRRETPPTPPKKDLTYNEKIAMLGEEDDYHRHHRSRGYESPNRGWQKRIF